VIVDKRLGIPLAAVIVVIVQVACIVGRPTETPTAPLLPGQAGGTESIATQAPGSAPIQSPAAGPATPTFARPPGGGRPETLQILSPRDGDLVNSPQVTVVGTTSPDSVVTVNDDIIVVGADGRFESTISLEQGPNVIEIVASDLEGNEATLELSINYQP